MKYALAIVGVFALVSALPVEERAPVAEPQFSLPSLTLPSLSLPSLSLPTGISLPSATLPTATGTAPVGTGTAPVGTGTAPVGTGTAPVGTGTSVPKMKREEIEALKARQNEARAAFPADLFANKAFAK